MEYSSNNIFSKIPLIIKVTGFLIFFGITGYIGLLFKNKTERPTVQTKAVSNNQAVKDKNKICVQIAGEVNLPGLYYLEPGARLAKLIEEAGGLTNNAELNVINFARQINDGEKIIVPATKNIFKKLGIGKGPSAKYMNPPIIIEKEE
jgi:hypothetical protein